MIQKSSPYFKETIALCSVLRLKSCFCKYPNCASSLEVCFVLSWSLTESARAGSTELLGRRAIALTGGTSICSVKQGLGVSRELC